MKIQRYTLPHDAGGCVGSWVLFTDHVADKAAAVADAVAVERKKTEAMRAELVASLRYCMGINCFSLRGWIRPLRERQDKAGNRLVELGEYESMERDGLTYYRPIEHRDSGESNAS